LVSSLVNDLQPRFLWIVGPFEADLLPDAQQRWSAARTVAAADGAANSLCKILDDFVDTVVFAERSTSQHWIKSATVSDLVTGLAYAVE
jgi:hypothetical protein